MTNPLLSAGCQQQDSLSLWFDVLIEVCRLQRDQRNQRPRKTAACAWRSGAAFLAASPLAGLRPALAQCLEAGSARAVRPPGGLAGDPRPARLRRGRLSPRRARLAAGFEVCLLDIADAIPQTGARACFGQCVGVRAVLSAGPALLPRGNGAEAITREGKGLRPHRDR
jgi:hypothetical protein